MRFLLMLHFLFLGTACSNETPPPIEPNKTRVAEALAYCKKKGMNQNIVCFLDMQQHSGLNRFMVYSFK